MKNIYSLLFAVVFFKTALLAQDPVRLSFDPNKQTLDPSLTYAVDQYLYYIIPKGTSHSVWRSDGTIGGTKEVFDLNQIYPNASGLPQGFISVGGKVFVSMQYNNDTSALLTFTHQDLQPTVIKLFRNAAMGGTTSSKHMRPMIAFNNKCWFGAEDFAIQAELKGVELWSSDGTTTGTKMEADLNTTGTFGFNTSSFPSNFLVYQSKLYFSALKWTGSGMNFNFVLYESDGSANNTKPYSNGSIVFSNPGAPYTAGAFKYKILSNELYISYRRPDNINQEEIYVQKVVTNGGLPVARTFFRFGDFGFFNGKVMISGIPATKGIMDATGPELYTYDTDLSTSSETLVKDINSSSAGGYIQAPYAFKELNNKVYMIATTNGLNEKQIWETDLTSAGTKAVTSYKYFNGGMHFSSFEAYQGRLYFNVHDSSIGNELYRLNPADNSISNWDLFTGSDNGVANNGLHPSTGDQNLIIAGGILYFTAIDSTFNYQLWKLGTASTGIAKLDEPTGLTIYPNPCQTKLTIESAQAFTHLTLVNLMGQVFWFEPNEDGSINIEQLAPGFYACMLYQNHTLVASKKLLKE